MSNDFLATVGSVAHDPSSPGTNDPLSDLWGEMVGPLEPPRAGGRLFVGHRKVRLGDVDRRARLRLDALTRYTQDVSDDDTTDLGLDPSPGWVVRSTVVDELAPAVNGENLRFETFCSGLGSRWAERRLTVTGELGARYEVASLWVCIDVDSGKPHRLTEQFLGHYGEAAGDRKVSARLTNPEPPAEQPGQRWQLRQVDFDVYGHVNNAAYWAVVEERLATWSTPRRGRLEYGRGLADPGDIHIVTAGTDPLGLWWDDRERGLDGPLDPPASAIVWSLPDGLYPE